jgi:hypothetical protein
MDWNLQNNPLTLKVPDLPRKDENRQLGGCMRDEGIHGYASDTLLSLLPGRCGCKDHFNFWNIKAGTGTFSTYHFSKCW